MAIISFFAFQENCHRDMNYINLKAPLVPREQHSANALPNFKYHVFKVPTLVLEIAFQKGIEVFSSLFETFSKNIIFHLVHFHPEIMVYWECFLLRNMVSQWNETVWPDIKLSCLFCKYLCHLRTYGRHVCFSKIMVANGGVVRIYGI